MKLVTVLGVAAAFMIAPAAPVAEESSDALARERNLGLAQYENEEYPKAAEQFEKCIALAPRSIVDHINLAVSALQAHDHAKAIDALLKARALDPSYPHVPYLLGIVYLRLDELDKARSEFDTLLKMDPLCAPAHYNLGGVLKKLKREDDAVAQWTETVRLDPNYGPAYFQLFNFYNARGEREKAQIAFREYTRTKQTNVGPGTTSADVEKSRYLGLLVETATPHAGAAKDIDVTLHDVTKEVGLDSAHGAPAAALADVDDDGDLDLLLGRSLYRNEHGHFVDATATAGLTSGEPALCADVGDFDNDGKLDVAIGGQAHVSLYRGNGDGTFEDVTEKAGLASARNGLPCTQLRFVDFDHDGDLDLVVAGSGAHPAGVLRNNGNGTFVDVSDASHIGGTRGRIQSIALADFDGHNDIDVFLAEAGGANALYMNRRDGTFDERATAAGLRSGPATAAAVAGDVNGDGLADIIRLGGAKRPVEVWLNRGDARFVKDAGSPVLARVTAALGPQTAALVDLDNDGDLDLVVAGGTQPKGLAVFRNDGAGGWTDATEAMLPTAPAATETRIVLAGDLDNDGDQDLLLIAPKGSVTVLRNDGGNRNHSVRVRLRGRKNNPDGYGAKVWVRQGTFFLLRETFARWIDLGVGTRTQLDVVGLRWPTGVTQNQLDVRVGGSAPLEFAERPGLAESCPFVYAFDGTQFRFVTDMLDTTPLGISLVPGVPWVPNHREAIHIPGPRLAAKDGLLSLRVTQELEEITYLDQLRLYAVDHPAGMVIVPNDRFSNAPFAPFAVHAVVPLAPLSAHDGQGHDIRSALLDADRVYAFDCPPIAPQYPGITTTHELVLAPGDLTDARHVTLFLRGTTLWTDASVNVAVAQNPDLPIQAVALDVIGKDGAWVRVRDDLGLPAGMDKTLPVALTGLFQSSDFRVRVTTNLALLWDQAFFAVERGAVRAPTPTVTALTPLFADLHYRGFSEVGSRDGKLPDTFVYGTLMAVPPFTGVHAGRYTRYGDVAELLASADDRYVILAPGDEVAVEFPAISLPALPTGWQRDYVFDADGWIKDKDLRTVHGDTVEPLPFHAMSGYPYPPTEHYPTTPQHRRYLETYQTRVLSEHTP